MKKLLWVLGCVCSLTMSGSMALADQMAATGGSSGVGLPFRVGVEAGIDLANLNGQNVNDVIGSRLGFVGGGFVSLPLTSSLALQPEVLYEQKGGKYNGNTYQLDYVEIPVLLNVTFGIPVLNPGIILGPTFDANVVNNGVNNVNNTDVGLLAGIQANLDKFYFSGRYEVGLTDVSSSQAIQNGTFTFLVGLSFL